MGILGSRLTFEEQLLEVKRGLNRSSRELERERRKLETSREKLVNDIRTQAANGDMTLAKTNAKNLVRTRQHIEKFHQMESHVKAVGLRLQTVKSTQAMSDSMQGVVQMMKKMNKEVNLPAMQNVFKTFMKESEKFGYTEDMMNHSIDAVIGNEDDEEEEDKIVKQVLDEIGIDLGEQIRTAPTSSLEQAVAPPRATAAPKAVLANGGPQAQGRKTDAQNESQIDSNEGRISPPSDLAARERDIEARLKHLRG